MWGEQARKVLFKSGDTRATARAALLKPTHPELEMLLQPRCTKGVKKLHCMCISALYIWFDISVFGWYTHLLQVGGNGSYSGSKGNQRASQPSACTTEESTQSGGWTVVT